MSFAEGVLRLVHIRAHVEPARHDGVAAAAPDGAYLVGPDRNAVDPVAQTLPVVAAPAGSLDADELETALSQAGTLDADAGPAAVPRIDPQPGIGDLEAAVALVSSGLASRVVLTGFPSWPGLLWRAYELAVDGVVIMPTVVRPGGRVDIAITRGERSDG